MKMRLPWPGPHSLRIAIVCAVGWLAPVFKLWAADGFATQLAQVHPGDVITVSGSHRGEFVTSVDGTANAPITIMGDGSALLLGASRDDPVLTIKHAYYRVRNIAVRGGQKGIYVTGAHGVLDGLQVSDTQEEGFTFKRAGARYWLVRNCSVQRTGLAGKYGEGFYVGDATSNWLSDRPDTPGYITFYNCYAADTVNDAWDFKEGAHHLKIINCTADMRTLQPLPVSSLPYDHTGLYCRADGVQCINFKVENLSEGHDLHGIGLHRGRGRDGIIYGHDIELKRVDAENIPRGALIYVEDSSMRARVYDDCTVRDVGNFFAARSAQVASASAETFVEMTWNGEGGEVWGGTGGPAGAFGYSIRLTPASGVDAKR